MKNPAPQGRVLDRLAGRLDNSDFTPRHCEMQAAARAIEAGLVILPEKPFARHATDCARLLRRHLDLPERLWLAASAILALPPDAAEQLAGAVLHDLRAGPPVPPFLSVRDEARDWAMFASPAELRAYLAASWSRLPDSDRRGFMRAVRQKKRMAP